MRLVSLISALLLTACGDVLYLEGSVNQLCQKLPAQSFTAIGIHGPTVPATTLEQRFDFDIATQLPKQFDHAQLTIGLERMTVTAKGPTDLRFIEAAKVTLEPPPSSLLPPRVVFRAVESSPTTVRFDGDDIELVPYLQSGVLSYTVALSAAALPTTMVADIDACANVALRWDYAR
jgi:hypothetical protein